jgi:hypothetical protein
MTVPVRCAGKQYPQLGGALAKREWPCEPRWKGKRKNDREYFGPYGMVPAAEVEPCPRCGGRVELIPATSP